MQKRGDILWNKGFVECWISYLMLNFSYQMLIPILPLYLIDHLGVNKVTTGVILASYTAGVLLVRPFSGYLVDCFSRKRLYLISFALFAMLFLGYYVVALPLAMMMVRFVQGSFNGIASVAGNTMSIDLIPSSRRGEGMGFFGLAINIAMALSQVVALYAYTTWGFNGVVSLAMCSAVIGTISVAAIEYPKRQPIEKPLFSLDRFILVKALPTALTFILLEAPYGMLLSFAIIYGIEIDVDKPSYFFIALAVGVAIARLISGRMIDRGKLHSISISSIVVLTISIALFSIVESANMFYALGFMLGVSYGVAVPAFQTLFVNVAPNNMRGTATSTYLSSFDVGSGLGMVIAGWVAEHYSLSLAYQIGAFMTLVSLFIYIFKVRESYNRHKII